MSRPAFIEQFRLRSNAFTRTRDLPFAHLVTCLLNLRKSSSEQELAGFFATLEEQPVASAVPSRAALSKARQGLSEKVFVHLNHSAIDTFRSGCRTPLWQGFRLLAVDGTTFRLPCNEAITRAFGEQPSGPPLARASVLYDIAHDLVVDAQVAAHCVGEHELAIDHLAAARAGDLLIYDRGYPAFWFFALHRAAGVDFCMRMSRSTFAPVNAFWNSQQRSRIVTLAPSSEQRRACLDQGVSAEPIRVRLVRVRLKGGDTEVLATSVLDEQRIPERLFAQLYHRRWSVEEYYKRQKRWAEIENFSGRSVLAVRQDIHAKILAVNLAAMLRHVAQLIAARRFSHRKRAYQVKGCSALSAMKNNLVRLLHSLPNDSRTLLTALARNLSLAVEALRPDRSFPRNNPGKLKPGYHEAYKRAA